MKKILLVSIVGGIIMALLLSLYGKEAFLANYQATGLAIYSKLYTAMTGSLRPVIIATYGIGTGLVTGLALFLTKEFKSYF